MSRIMLAAMSSGSGKTTVTWGLLAALRDRGVDVRAFKCGPDYIDPMFHTRLLGIPSRNLDLFLQGERAVKRTLSRHGGSLAVLEGAMGFYDGPVYFRMNAEIIGVHGDGRSGRLDGAGRNRLNSVVTFAVAHGIGGGSLGSALLLEDIAEHVPSLIPERRKKG